MSNKKKDTLSEYDIKKIISRIDKIKSKTHTIKIYEILSKSSDFTPTFNGSSVVFVANNIEANILLEVNKYIKKIVREAKMKKVISEKDRSESDINSDIFSDYNKGLTELMSETGFSETEKKASNDSDSEEKHMYHVTNKDMKIFKKLKNIELQKKNNTKVKYHENIDDFYKNTNSVMEKKKRGRKPKNSK